MSDEKLEEVNVDVCEPTENWFKKSICSKIWLILACIAPSCMRVWGSCFKTECLGVFAHIRHVKCPKNNGTKNPCPARDEWVKAKALLEGKEVILEVI